MKLVDMISVFDSKMSRFKSLIDNELDTIYLNGPALLKDPINYIKKGGKRLRPSLCLLICEMFNVDISKALIPAVSVELLHLFSLIHDDIMDRDDLRHNKFTLHKKWNISAKIGGGANQVGSYNRIGIITGGSISYGKINGGKFGADLKIIINTSRPTLGITGFYEWSIFKYISLKGGVCYLQTWATPNKINIGGTAGIGVFIPIGKKFILQPMTEVNFGSIENNIFGVNMNLGFSF